MTSWTVALFYLVFSHDYYKSTLMYLCVVHMICFMSIYGPLKAIHVLTPWSSLGLIVQRKQ